MPDLLIAALRCADRIHAGVIPIAGKRPLGQHGYGSASSDAAKVRRLFAAARNVTGFGIAAGDRLVILDVDDVGALEELGETLPHTLTARSGGGGFHVYFLRPVGLQLSYRRDRWPVGLEVKLGAGGCVAPPSLHESGERYRWARRMPPAQSPPWLLELLCPPERPAVTGPRLLGSGESAYGRAALQRHADLVASAQDGTRRTQLNGSVFALAQLVPSGHLHAETIAAALTDAAAATGLPALEIRRTIAHALADGQTRPYWPSEASA